MKLSKLIAICINCLRHDAKSWLHLFDSRSNFLALFFKDTIMTSQLWPRNNMIECSRKTHTDSIADELTVNLRWLRALRRLSLERVYEEGIYFLHTQWIFPIYTKETELFFCWYDDWFARALRADRTSQKARHIIFDRTAPSKLCTVSVEPVWIKMLAFFLMVFIKIIWYHTILDPTPTLLTPCRS